MLIISRVCAEFHDKKGTPLFNVTPAMRNLVTEAPESIRQDPLFDMLIQDGSLEAVTNIAQRQRLENDPGAGHDATGKLIPTEAAAKSTKTKASNKPAAEKTAAKDAPAEPADGRM